jgi:nitrous oxidase accessory protein
MKRVFLLCLAVLIARLLLVADQAAATGVINGVVSPRGVYADIHSALQEAEDGDVIQVRGGTYPGPLLVDKSIVLEGVGWPVIDGSGRGTVVTLSAPGAVLKGFQIIGSGMEPDRNHAGIEVSAEDVVVEGNRLSDVLFGIFVAQADRVLIRGNEITSKAEYNLGRQGDGIRLWYSQEAVIESNLVSDVRDLVLWYSKDVLVKDNLIQGGRYGLHLMYCDGARIENNRLYDNSVGIYTMYSSNILLSGNDIRGQRGPSGYGLGFKDVDNLDVQSNLLVDNRGGIFIDGTPYRPGSYAKFSDNFMAYNDIGVTLVSAVKGAEFEANSFWENDQQVSLQGGGMTSANTWVGNFWSDYSGLDTDTDGTGDTPYLAEQTFENLTDREPLLRALSFSPAVQAIEMAAQTFPLFKARPKLVDPIPIYLPPAPPLMTARPETGDSRASMAVLGISLAILCLALCAGFYYIEIYTWERDCAGQKSFQAQITARKSK